MTASEMCPVLAVALACWVDHRFGEPRNAFHPVAWLGRALAPVGRRLLTLSPVPAFCFGAFVWLLAVGSVAGAAVWLQDRLLALPWWAAAPLLSLMFKPTFAWRMLKDEVRGVEAALESGIEEGRQRLSRLCSRDVSQLGVSGIRETAIETLAENLNDSVVAPLFWFVVAGLPGAWVWRATNTLDAMWGYRGPWEWAGKWAARADDVLAWVPARIAAALLWRPPTTVEEIRREARRTPSPNGGWPMAAMAHRLNVRLGKPGVYVLNAAGAEPDGAALRQALRASKRAVRGAFVLAIIAALLVTMCSSAPWN